jgi:RNA polymerase sigma-70 factor (ECF subfamily)
MKTGAVEARVPSGRKPEAPLDDALVDALRAGDEAAFTTLVERHHASLLRVARVYLRDGHAAEEVVQDTWIVVLTSIDRFESRSSFKTWLFSILANKARTRWSRDRRAVPFSSLGGDDPESAGEPAVDPDRFRPSGRWAGHWSVPPRTWAGLPEERLLARETLDVVQQAIEALPPRQRQVIVLRDVEGFPSDEVCAVLDLSEGNQRVLLHRARSHVRAALERHLDGEVLA